ncbi:MAG: hypothetical protein HYU52_14180 [Acidobacteria bacterium]|nr:hypothetical protein [Acidobacteriota bacterium]
MTTIELEVSSPERLKAIVLEDNVAWGVLPRALDDDPYGRRLAFEVEIRGFHVHPNGPLSALCARCKKVLVDLLEVAQWVAPDKCPRQHNGHQQGGHTRFCFSPIAQSGGRVRTTRVKIDLNCQSTHDGHVDEGCDICLQRTGRRLAALGARRLE